MKRILVWLFAGLGMYAAQASGQETTPGEEAAIRKAVAPVVVLPEPLRPGEEAAIRKAVAAYVEAFNKHDAEALAKSWSPDAVYQNQITDEEVVGRAAIGEQFAALFKAQPEIKLAVSVNSIRLVSPNVAIEQGTAQVVLAKDLHEATRYSAVHVRREGQWLLDRVTDQASEESPSHFEQLKSLEWMVGDWASHEPGVQVEISCDWAKNGNFLTRSFRILVEDRVDMSGIQVIGWDAASKSVRSWTFDSDGGFAEASWSRKGNVWQVHNKGVLADGRQATMVNVIKPVDAYTFTWQTIERTAGGELLPNLDEVTIVRQ